jgi:hypothetical protein
MKKIKTIIFPISGLVIIVYSPFAVAHIHEGENYLMQHYWEALDVICHIEKGTLTGFYTGSPGVYVIRVMMGCPSPEATSEHEFKVELGIEVRDHQVCVRDLYDLLRWTGSCPSEKVFEINKEWYRIILYSNKPSSGIPGDNQDILTQICH